MAINQPMNDLRHQRGYDEGISVRIDCPKQDSHWKAVKKNAGNVLRQTETIIHKTMILVFKRTGFPAISSALPNTRFTALSKLSKKNVNACHLTIPTPK